MFVKICGTTNLEDARLSVELGADALGFIFAPSKRRVTVEQAAAITARLPGHVQKVGVFTEPSPRLIVDTVRAAGLTAVQLHMEYDSERIGQLAAWLGPGIALWQVVGIDVEPRLAVGVTDRIRRPLLDPRLSVVLLDAVKDGASGGLGKTFAWEAVDPSLVQRATVEALARREGLRAPKLVVAGGLNSENVREAIAHMKPWGVDVVSGVEDSPGKKSPDRLRAFFEAVRCAV